MKLTWLKSSKGNSEIPLIIIVIIGAFFLAGGQYMFQGLTSADKTSINPGSGSAPLPSSDWSIELVNTTCDPTNKLSNVMIELHGPSTGYYTVSVGNTQINLTNNIFTPVGENGQTPVLSLPNSSGINTTAWKIMLYSGTVPTGTTTETPEAQKDMQPTRCT